MGYAALTLPTYVLVGLFIFMVLGEIVNPWLLVATFLTLVAASITAAIYNRRSAKQNWAQAIIGGILDTAGVTATFEGFFDRDPVLWKDGKWVKLNLSPEERGYLVVSGPVQFIMTLFGIRSGVRGMFKSPAPDAGPGPSADAPAPTDESPAAEIIPKRPGPGLEYEVNVEHLRDGNQQITLRNNQVIDRNTGKIVNADGPPPPLEAFPKISDAHNALQGTYNQTTQDLYIEMYRTTSQRNQIGTEMIGKAIDELGGPSKVKTLSGEVGGDNAKLFDKARKAGIGREDAVWQTPLGQAARALGFKKLTYGNRIVTFER